jgi:hypothetical protein
LYARIGSAKVEISVFYSEGVQGPWAARVGVWVYELGICDENESMGICVAGLLNMSEVSRERLHLGGLYPILPILPLARCDAALEETSLTPVHCNAPEDH